MLWNRVFKYIHYDPSLKLLKTTSCPCHPSTQKPKNSYWNSLLWERVALISVPVPGEKGWCMVREWWQKTCTHRRGSSLCLLLTRQNSQSGPWLKKVLENQCGDQNTETPRTFRSICIITSRVTLGKSQLILSLSLLLCHMSTSHYSQKYWRDEDLQGQHAHK